jgi:hypothetical protein
MKTTNKSKTILNISIALSIVLCSLSLFLYSCQINPAKAATEATITDDGYEAVGVFIDRAGNAQGNEMAVIGYNSTTGDMKILAKKRLNPYN